MVRAATSGGTGEKLLGDQRAQRLQELLDHGGLLL
jgi:hypothetical protein